VLFNLHRVAAKLTGYANLAARTGITTPVLVPLSPDGNQMNGLKAVFAAFER